MGIGRRRLRRSYGGERAREAEELLRLAAHVCVYTFRRSPYKYSLIHSWMGQFHVREYSAKSVLVHHAWVQGAGDRREGGKEREGGLPQNNHMTYTGYWLSRYMAARLVGTGADSCCSTGGLDCRLPIPTRDVTVLCKFGHLRSGRARCAASTMSAAGRRGPHTGG